MPMVLYQIRNEYGLAERELYKSADKNDPEALLEGVAMAGLAGVLRQLGDLSTFAAEIFHNLHEQVMATAARGHRVMLRVQELEAEFPSIGKAFLAQTSHSRLSYTTKQCDWHANLELDQNLITQGDMPRFIVNSYEECRGPPQLFMLDKFDTAGAGACLKRYSDPSFFKTNLVSSGMVEEEIRREKEACKLKKKGLHWRNDETLESFFVLRDSNSQPNMSDQVCEKIPTKQVKLKYRHMNIPDTGRNYMEKVFEVHSTKQERLLENSISHSHTKMSVDSSESVSEVHEIVDDCSAKSPLLKARSLTQSPTKQEETELSTKSKKDKREGAELSETVPDMIVATRKTCLNISIAKIDEVSSKVESIRSTNGYRSGEAEESPSALRKMDQMELLRDDDCKSGGEPDGYRSDDVSSERENYMDALNTLGSEVETDNESRAKSDTGSINVQYQGMDFHYNKGKQQLQAHFSEPDDVESSPASSGLKNLFRNSLSSISDLDTFDNLVVCAVPQGNIIACDLQVNPEVYLSERNDESSEGLFNDCKGVEPKSVVVVISETNDKPSEGLLGDGEELELKSSDPVLCNRTSDARKSAASYLRSKTGEFSSNSCVTDLALSLNLLFHQGSSDETQAVDATTNEILSDFVEGAHVVAERSYADQSCTTDMSDLPDPAKDELRLPRLEGNSEMSSVKYADMRSLGDVTGTPDGPSHLSQTQDANNLEEVPVCYVEDSSFSSPVPDKEPEESVKQDTEVTSRGCTSPIMTPSGAHHSSIVVQPDCLVVEMENVIAPTEDLEKFRSVTGFEIADDCVENKTSVSKVPPPESKHYSDALEPQEHCNIFLSALIPQSAEEESFPSDLLLESETSNKIDGLNPIGDNLKQSYESMVVDPIEDEMQIGLTQFDDLSPEEVSEHDPCPIYAPEHENGFHIHSQEEFVPCEAAPNQHNLEEDETPGLKDDVELDFESIWNMPLSTEKDDQVASAPKISISDSLVQDLYNPYDDKFLENICSLPSEHAHEDYPHSDQGNHSTDSDKENEVLSLLRKKKIDLKTSLQYAHGNGQEYMASSTHLLTEYSNPFEKASDIQAGSEPEFNSPWEDGEDREHLLPSYLPEREQSTGETSLLNDSLDLTFKASEPEPHDFVSSGTTSALDTPPYSHPMPEIPVSFENTSEASASSLAPTMVPQSPSYQGFCLASFGTTSGQISEPSVREPVSSSPIRDLKETPPLPPLPPLEWRTGKIRLGSLPSDGNVKVLPIEQLSTTDKKQPHSSLTPRDETAQPADLPTSLPELEENVQPNFVSERKMVQPLRLSELPPIVEDKRHPNGIIFSERESVHPFHPPPVESPIEDDKHLYAPIALEGCMLHLSNPFVLLHEQSMESTHLSALLQSSDNGTSLLDQVRPDLESNRSQHGFPGLERDDLLHLNPYSVIDVKQNYGVYGGERMQPSNMTVPLPTTGPMIIPHGFAPFVGQNLFSPYDIIDPTAEDEKPYRRHGSLLNQPRSPLMEVVSSPDKNKLRKISEMVQPPIRPKEGESDTLLEQIRKKSVELKPAVVTKPSIMGPPTNLKFAAILEKADAIRHAFVVSSENDDDGDSWSDS